MTEVAQHGIPLFRDAELGGNIINPRKSLSNSIKGLILSGLLQQKNKKQYTVRSAFLVWHKNTKVLSLTQQAMMKILISQSISQQTFLYRIKAFAYQKMKQQKSKNEEKLVNQKLESNTKNKECQNIVTEDKGQKYQHMTTEAGEQDKLNNRTKGESNKAILQQRNSSFFEQKARQSQDIESLSRQFFIKSDIQRNIEHRLLKIEAKAKVGCLRACQLLIKRRILKNKKQAFYKILI